MAQYHLRRIGREFPFKAHRLPLMMTDLIWAYRHKADLISNISPYFIRLPLELFSAAHDSLTGRKIPTEARHRKAWAGKTTLFLSFRYQRRPEYGWRVGAD